MDGRGWIGYGNEKEGEEIEGVEEEEMRVGRINMGEESEEDGDGSSEDTHRERRDIYGEMNPIDEER